MERTILVVDDDPHLLELLTTVLVDAGYRVRQARDGLAALAEVERAVPDLVLTDVMMPRLGGFGLAEQLRRRPRPIPVVLMSAAAGAPRGGELTFVAKPFDIDDLLARIAAALAAAAG